MVQAGGGTGAQSDYTYLWSPSGQTSNIANNLVADHYTVTTTDLSGCISTASVTITEPDEIITTNASIDPTCFGESNGSIVISASGGTGFLLYSWNPNNSANPNNFANGLPAGNYSITVTDFNGCSTSTGESLIDPPQLIASISSTDSYCTAANGTASIFNVSGGTGTYSYAWNNLSNSSPQLTNVMHGDYDASVTDANGCVTQLAININDQVGPTIVDFDITSPQCSGENNGALEVITSNGTTPLTFLWNDNQINPTASNLVGGNYCVTVTDANGCMATDCESVPDPTPIQLSLLSSNPTPCSGQETTVWGIPSGGTTPYVSITWSGDGTGLTGYGNHIINMPPNSDELYIAQVTDSEGCQDTDTINLVSGTQLLIDSPALYEICLGDNVNICSVGSGGLGSNAYEWTWNNGATCSGLDTCCQTVNPTDTVEYQVTLEDGCTTPADAIITVIVNPIPTPAFAVLENEGCPPFTAYFNGNSSMDNSTLNWDFNGDGITDT